MKTIVCLYGGPGSGKSTVAADLFRIAKQQDVNAELVREYIKNWVWEGRDILPGDQMYIAAKQSRAERICLGKVDLIVTDSPMLLAQYYEELHDKDTQSISQLLIKKHNQITESFGYKHLHVFLNRTKKYNPKGRFQNEEEARQIDSSLKDLLDRMKWPYLTLDGDCFAAMKIFHHLTTES
jgi:nicotinamide riboside kinase